MSSYLDGFITCALINCMFDCFMESHYVHTFLFLLLAILTFSIALHNELKAKKKSR